MVYLKAGSNTEATLILAKRRLMKCGRSGIKPKICIFERLVEAINGDAATKIFNWLFNSFVLQTGFNLKDIYQANATTYTCTDHFLPFAVYLPIYF